MKRLIPLALTVLALAAVPVAFGDDGSTPPATTTPAPVAQQAPGNAPKRFELLRLRIEVVAQRFAKHCRSNATGAPQACLDFANRVEGRLTKLDANIKARIEKIQTACTTTSTGAKCKNVALLQQLDQRVKDLTQKVHDWLAGQTAATSPSNNP